jgi:hypothetical protein
MAVQTITYDDKSYLNQNSEIADVNKINDTDMNEIKSVVNNNATELSNIKLNILWSNPNPTNNFSAQSITLSSNDYDYLIFVCRFQSGNDLVSQFTLKNYGAIFGIGWDYNGGSGITYYSAGYRRTFAYSSDTSYSASDCYVRYSNSSSNTIVNNYIVPLFVYGGKF